MNYIKALIFCFYISFFNLNAQTVSIISYSLASCSGPCDGAATFSISGANGPYSVSITNTACTTPTTTLFTTDSVTISNLCKCTSAYTFKFYDVNDSLIGAQNLNIYTGGPPLSIFATNSALSCNGACNASGTVSVFNGSAPYNYTWSPTGINTPIASSLCAGYYTITVTDAVGCMGATALLILNPSNPCVGIEEIASPKFIKIFPNPVSTTLHLSIDEHPFNASFEIYNLVGQTVLIGDLTEEINVSSLFSGVYYIKITSKTDTYYSKIIKE